MFLRIASHFVFIVVEIITSTQYAFGNNSYELPAFMTRTKTMLHSKTRFGAQQSPCNGQTRTSTPPPLAGSMLVSLSCFCHIIPSLHISRPIRRPHGSWGMSTQSVCFLSTTKKFCWVLIFLGNHLRYIVGMPWYKVLVSAKNLRTTRINNGRVFGVLER